MIIFGSRELEVVLDDGHPQHCQVCEDERLFHTVLRYQHQHLYYIFGSVKNKEYRFECELCSHGESLDANDVEGQLGRTPIPFMQRRGGWVFLLGIPAFWVCVFLGALVWRWANPVDRAGLFGGPGSQVAAETPLEVNDRVLSKWGGSWYKATVVEVLADGKVKIHYLGYDAAFDTVVPRANLRIEAQAN